MRGQGSSTGCFRGSSFAVFPASNLRATPEATPSDSIYFWTNKSTKTLQHFSTIEITNKNNLMDARSSKTKQHGND